MAVHMLTGLMFNHYMSFPPVTLRYLRLSFSLRFPRPWRLQAFLGALVFALRVGPHSPVIVRLLRLAIDVLTGPKSD